MIRIAIATSNKHKVEEANEVLKRFGIEVYPVNVKKVEVQSENLEEIAVEAARYAYREFGKPIIVEDSGLFIRALNGFPGPYSSYVYKTIGLWGVLKLLEGCDDRSAYFKAVVALALDERNIQVFTGVVEGFIAYEARGSQGFGFDPIFVPLGYDKTFAELGKEVKCRISHRAKAFEELAKWVSANIEILSPYNLRNANGGS